MKAAFTLLALAGFALATPQLTKRDTNCKVDADKVPAENDCRDLVGTLEDRDQAEKLKGGEAVTVACSDTCRITVTSEEDDGQIVCRHRPPRTIRRIALTCDPR